MIHRFCWSAWTGAALALLLTACSPRYEPPLMVGTNIWAGYETLYLARDLGYYDEQALRLVELGSTSQTLDALRTGKLDIAGLTLDEALALAHDGVPIAVIWVMNISAGADAIVARAPLNEVAQLRGLRIGVEQTAVGAYLLQGALRQAQLKINEVTVVPLPVDEHIAAWRSRSVDALVTFDPARATLLREGGNEIYDSRSLPGEIVDVLVARRSALACCAARITALLQGQRRALAYLAAQREDALLRMSRRPGSTPAEVGAALDGMELPDGARNRRLLQAHAHPPEAVENLAFDSAGHEQNVQETAYRLAQTMRKQGLLTQAVDVQALVDDRFARGHQP